MTRKLRKTDIRVEVYPRREGEYWFANAPTPESNEKYELEGAQRILAEVTRHVDNVSSANLAYTIETVCGYTDWCTDDTGNVLDRWPACCTKDQYDFYRDNEAENDEWFFQHGMDDLDYLQEFRDGYNNETKEN